MEVSDGDSNKAAMRRGLEDVEATIAATDKELAISPTNERAKWFRDFAQKVKKTFNKGLGIEGSGENKA